MDIKECATGGAVILDFLPQYEENGWAFSVRLASHYRAFLGLDYQTKSGGTYFGIPDYEGKSSLNEGAYSKYGSRKSEEELEKSVFLRRHKSCLVNPEHVAKIGKHKVILQNSEELGMGREQRG